MLAWENSGVSIDSSVRITLFRPHLRVSCQSLEHLLRYCARPPFALERLSVIRDASGRISRIRYVMPRHKAANVGKQREAATGGHRGDGHGTTGCCDANQKPRSHDTSRIAWAKLMARVGEKFPLQCPACGGDIRLRGDCRQEPAHAK